MRYIHPFHSSCDAQSAMAGMCRHIYLPIVQPADTRHRFSCPPLLSIVFSSFPRCLRAAFIPLSHSACFLSECATHLLPYILILGEGEKGRKKGKERVEKEREREMCVCACVRESYSLLPLHPTTLSFPVSLSHSYSPLISFWLFYFSFFSLSIWLFLHLNSAPHKCWHSSFTSVLLNWPFGKLPALIKGILETNKKQKPAAFHLLPL